MAGFSERLSAMKEKQEASERAKREQAEKATEAARLEREAKRSELSTERDTVLAEFIQAEQAANEAREAIAQADAFAEQQGDNLDPEAKAEIDALKLEAEEAQEKFEELKTRLDGLNTEISAFEESGALQETSEEPTAEVVQDEERAAEEAPQVEAEQAPEVTAEKSAEVLQPETVAENQESVSTEEVVPSAEQIQQQEKAEKIKELEQEINGLLDEITSKFPDQMIQIFNSEAYKNLVASHEKRKAEEKSLFELYDRHTKSKDGHMRRVTFAINDAASSVKQYINDLKFHNAPQEVIKRFEEYPEKYREPEQQANEKFGEELQAMNQDRWDFESFVDEKTTEVFKDDPEGKRDFERKVYNTYNNRYHQAQANLGKQLYINTLGTIYDL